ncbi:MAG: hypothetical protein ACYDHW_12090 [Syntrophorhabdaceae bacterium]
MRLKCLLGILASLVICLSIAGIYHVVFAQRIAAGHIERFVLEQKDRYVAGKISAEELVQIIQDRLDTMQGKHAQRIGTERSAPRDDREIFSEYPASDESEE